MKDWKDMREGKKTKRDFGERQSGRMPGAAVRGGRALAVFLQVLFTVLVIAVGVVVMLVYIKLKKPPQKVALQVPAPLVKVEHIRVQDIPMVIRGHGTVSPKVEVEIIPEVAGKVVQVHPSLEVGGFIPADQCILRIDPRDYELAVQQARAAVAETEVRLDTEKAEAEVARKEWEQLHPGTEPDSPLVLRVPQIRQAEAGVESAKAQLATAELRLERTSLSLPFDALIISERVDPGQYVVAGQSLGTAYGIEAVEIEVPLEDRELAWFDVFGRPAFDDANGTPPAITVAEVKAVFAGTEHRWKGYVTRTAGQVDRLSRMVPVIVEVPTPFEASDGRPPLLPGAFVEVSIKGSTLSRAAAVPRAAIRDGDSIWLVNNNRLHIRPLEIVRADKDFAYVSSWFNDEVTVVVSSLDTVVEGMDVRTRPGGIAEADSVDSKGDEDGRVEVD